MSLFLHRKKNNRIWTEIACVLSAILLAVSFFAALLSALRISWSFEKAFDGGLVSGLVCAWNKVADTLGNTDYLLLPKYDGAGESCGLFLTILFILVLIIAWLLIKSRFTPGLLIFALPQIFLAIYCGLYPKTGWIIFSAAALGIALAVMKMQDGFLQALVYGAIVSALALLVLSAVDPLLSESGYGRTVLGDKVAELVYGKEDLGKGDLSIRKRSVREGEALSVTMSDPQSYYLRGFTGTTFTGNSWQELSPAAAYQAKDLMDALKEEGFHAAGQLAETAGYVYEDIPENRITIKNTGTDRRIVYVPYEITEEGDLSTLKKRGGSTFDTGKWTGKDAYSFRAAENQTDNWTDAAARYFTIALKGDESAEPALDQLRLESHYNTFVYETFTQLRKQDREILAANIGSAGDQSKGHVDYKKAITAIRSFLEDTFIYTEDLGDRSEDATDAISDFFSSHKGFDVQYATAATLMFRYYGIPARYVEGYLLTPDDASAADSNGTVSVGRDRVHAWTEIYIDGAGFVPLEVTPEYYGVMDEADLSVGISNEQLMKDFEQLYGERNAEEEEDNDRGNKNDSEAFLKVLRIVLIAFGALVAAAALFFLLRALIIFLVAAIARRKLFKKSDPKTAVAAIYGYMEELKLSPDEETVALGNYAAYSPHEVTEEDRSKMLLRLKELKKNKK